MGRTRAKRLRGFGNAIVLPLATAFVASVIDAFVDASRSFVEPALAVEAPVDSDPAVAVKVATEADPAITPGVVTVPEQAPSAEDHAA
jgi:hypothetical protein